MSTNRSNPPRLRGPLRIRVALSMCLVPVLLSIATIAIALSWHDRLPDPVAIRFSGGGEPNDWMSLNANYAFTILLLAGFNAVSLCIALFDTARGKMGMLLGSILSGVVALVATLLVLSLHVQLDGAEPRFRGSAFLFGLLAAVVCAGITAVTFPTQETEPPKIPPSPAGTAPREPLRHGEKVVFFGGQSGSPALVGGVSAILIGSAVLSAFAAWWVAAIVLVSGIIAVPFISYIGVRIDELGVSWAFGFGAPRGTIALSDIKSADVIDINPIEFGGWGYRITPDTTGLIVRKGPGIRITRKAGRDVVISLAQPDDAVETLRQLLART